MKPDRLTWLACGLFAATGLTLGLAYLWLGSDRALGLVLLGLILSVVSIPVSLALAFRSWHRRFRRVAEVLDGTARDVEIAPSDRMPNP